MAAHPVDLHVGQKIRERRLSLSMTLRNVAEALGLTFQQIQKYESGANRIGSSRLYDFARVLDVPIAYFFDGMPSGGRRSSRIEGLGDAVTPFANGKDPLASRETRDLVTAYYRIREVRLRKRVYELLRTAGAVSHADAVAKGRRGVDGRNR
ncbi:Transcriptional regulator, contains XRE-family HTH domain [Enhydrobacter aerosaccus]|uniref:Transcriptional regulator, contains XRE-family HTH domain n=1 Tax=Enhydrobacter aerosaccus TaxID=225324 RepID=A0A1T4SPS5_9HYPH|nr:helix-turn-helix transcriptional regulator [Enhydrobacter aerosaccus]SKA30156.1 Transcriptional regulator, contains XRE-family HTH domain [Enhydrobacter aerosaccus]